MEIKDSNYNNHNKNNSNNKYSKIIHKPKKNYNL